jgi:hypothetical protein
MKEDKLEERRYSNPNREEFSFVKCICPLRVPIVPLSTIFLLEFGNVSSV